MGPSDSWNPGDPIGYIQPEIPEFEMPSYRGERYEAMVPDTLDLAERARLAIHVMTENPNPQADYEPYWRVSWTPGPIMTADFASPSITPKFQESVCLDRIMSGSEQNLHVDRRWMEITLQQQGPDGLIYTPTKGRPWAFFQFDPSHYGGTINQDMEQLIGPFISGQILRAMSLYDARDGSSFWKEPIRRLVDGLASLAVDAGDYAYYWPGPFYAEKNPPADVKPRYQFHLGEMSIISFGLSCAYRRTGYEPALTLAKKLIAFQKAIFFTPEGEFLTAQKGSVKSHLHAHARALQSFADYALLTNDEELLEFVVKSYEWTKTRIENLIGFFPNHVSSPGWREPSIPGELDEGTTEEFVKNELNPCEFAGGADMIGLALQLSEAGVADYWDDVDRWTRNMLAESQILRTDWVYHLPGSVAITSGDPARYEHAIHVTPAQSIDRVPERNLGSWPTSAAPNDWYEDGSGARGLVHGDTACAARTIYWIWHRILTHRDGKLRVNLLLNRASRWADVDSYVPYQGRVEIKIKQPVDLDVRVPEWVSPKDVRVQVDETERNVDWDGRYVHVGEVRPGDTAIVTFPIAERRDVVYIEKRKYTLVRRGNDVVEIYPRGRYYPFYQRQHYRSGEPRWRKVQRFVSQDQIDWI